MFKVSRDQINDITDTRRIDFRERTDAKLITDFSAAPHYLEHDDILARSAAGWSMAEAHGMISERDHIRYLYLRVALGTDWDVALELEWLRTLFQSDRTGRQKLDMAETAVKGATQS